MSQVGWTQVGPTVGFEHGSVISAASMLFTFDPVTQTETVRDKHSGKYVKYSKDTNRIKVQTGTVFLKCFAACMHVARTAVGQDTRTPYTMPVPLKAQTLSVRFYKSSKKTDGQAREGMGNNRDVELN